MIYALSLLKRDPIKTEALDVSPFAFSCGTAQQVESGVLARPEHVFCREPPRLS